jgi:hypothetical protein
MGKDITKINTKGQFHGYQETYWNDELWYRGAYKHGHESGYTEINLLANKGIGDKGTKVIFFII